MKHVDNQWATLSFTGNTFWFPYISGSTEQRYELNAGGTPFVSVTTTQQQVDASGNSTQIVVATNDGYQKTTTNTYKDDYSNWYLGRLILAQVAAMAPAVGSVITASLPTKRTSAFAYDPQTGLLVSEDLDEILELADRIAVMSGGRIDYVVPAAEADRTSIGRAMAGH